MNARIEPFDAEVTEFDDQTCRATYTVSFMGVDFTEVETRGDKDDAIEEGKQQLASALEFLVGNRHKLEYLIDRSEADR